MLFTHTYSGTQILSWNISFSISKYNYVRTLLGSKKELCQGGKCNFPERSSSSSRRREDEMFIGIWHARRHTMNKPGRSDLIFVEGGIVRVLPLLCPSGEEGFENIYRLGEIVHF